MALRLHMLNVGHGDCTVLEYEDESGASAFGVIDSNRSTTSNSPALDFLVDRGVTELSFVVLTHPHLDHYTGLLALLERFRGRVGHFFTFPFPRNRDALEKYARSLQESVAGNSSGMLVRGVRELIGILVEGHNAKIWEVVEGLDTVIDCEGFDGVSIRSILPPAKVKGPLFERLEQGRGPLHDKFDNGVSLAISVSFAGRTIVIGGDGTAENWQFTKAKRARAIRRGESPAFNADVCRLPHHGSRADSGDEVLDFLFAPRGTSKADAATESRSPPIALISAEGRAHPHHEVLNSLSQRGIAPYCTNLSTHCGADPPVAPIQNDAVDPVLLRTLNQAVVGTRSATAPCQGNVTVEISEAGAIRVERQYSNACFFRGEYLGLC